MLAAALSTGCGNSAGDPESVVKQTGPGVWENSIGMIFRRIPDSEAMMAIYETRVEDFVRFVEDTSYDATKGMYYYAKRMWRQDPAIHWKTPNFMQTNNYPVCGVNWRDAVAFCTWLTDLEQQGGTIKKSQVYRLPTLDEWASAAGGQTQPPYPEHFGNYHQEAKFDYTEFTSAVGTFKPNEHGFYDMAGNVWEYTLDESDEEPGFYVICGGSWQNWHKFFVGMNARGYCSPDIRITLYGFRVVLAPRDDHFTRMRNEAMQVTPMAEPPPP